MSQIKKTIEVHLEDHIEVVFYLGDGRTITARLGELSTPGRCAVKLRATSHALVVAPKSETEIMVASLRRS